MRQPASETAIVELILATGSNAGVRASIFEGFYMIGRHAECQIRPKSKSVSRRHCLIHHAAGAVRVLDLNSTTGTIVNTSRLDPRSWRTLENGDQIRCGKVIFQLSIANVAGAGKLTRNDSMAAGEAWHDFDVAGFLDAEDEADREERYSNIRAGGRKESEDSDVDTEIESLESLEEAFAEEGDTLLLPTANPPNSAAKKKQDRATGKGTPKKPTQPVRIPMKRGPRKTWSFPSFSFRLDGSDQLKLIGAILVTIAIIGFFGYQIHKFSSPTSTRVVKELDY